MTILAAGYGLRNLAGKGMASVARAESIENQQQLAIDQAEQAQDTQTLSMGTGIGASYGVSKVLDNAKTAKDANAALNKSFTGQGTVGNSGGGLTFTPDPTLNAAGESVAGEMLTGVDATTKINELAATADLATAAEVATVSAEAGAVAVGGEVAGAGAVAGQAGAATAAASGTGTAATLGAIAAPIAIGLGVAFLLNELF
tara:strand:- start:470 stop:1072 length:603 start_codon:yes stop_codon:yes gene_type:complete